MTTVHMAEAEGTANFAAVLEKVRQGAEIVVEHNHEPVAVLRPAVPLRRKLSEVLLPPRAGRMFVYVRGVGTRFCLSVFLIGTTALELVFSVMFSNPRHFALIPSLTVNPL